MTLPTEGQIVYQSSTLLSCRCTQGAEVIICLVDSSILKSGSSYIEGTLNTFTEGRDVCGYPLYAYYITYDATDFVDPLIALLPSNIAGVVCKGCLTDYIDWKTRPASKGTTADRPAFLRYIGQLYLDTDLDADGLPIWWNGTKWIKADGSDA